MPIAWAQDFKRLYLTMTQLNPTSAPFRVGFDPTNNCLELEVETRTKVVVRSMPPLYAPAKLISEEISGDTIRVVLRKMRTGFWPRLTCDDWLFPFVTVDGNEWKDADELSLPSEDSFAGDDEDVIPPAESAGDDDGDVDNENMCNGLSLHPPCVDADVTASEEESAEEPEWGNVIGGCTPGGQCENEAGASPKRASPTLCRLSLDLIVHILSFLPAETIGAPCCLVSTRMNLLCSSKELWKQMCERDLPSLTKRLTKYIENLRCRAARHRDPSTSMVRLEGLVQSGILNANIIDWAVPVLTNASILSSVWWKQAYRSLPILTPIAIADQRNNRIKITRCDGTVLHAFSCDDMQAPSGIVLLRDNRLAVTEFLNSRVLILNSTGAAEVCFPTGYMPRGIAQLPDGNLVVCQYGMGRVTVHSLTGEVVSHLSADFYGPSGVTVLEDGNIAITECNANRIRIFDPVENKPVRIIGTGEDGSDDLDLAEPRGIATLRGGLLAVCDGGSNRITITTQTGRLIRHIDGNFRCPAGIAVLPDGDLIAVTDTDHHRICIIRWADGRIIRSFGTSLPGRGPNQFSFPRCIAVLNCL